jgi:GNAT superfamily N-acetyltransferase
MVHPFTIRTATATDARGIAEVNIRSWRETYPGIMPETLLASLSLESCTRNWDKALATGSCVIVAVMDERIVGFVSGGPNRQHEDNETGLANSCECELATLYLLRSHQKLGIGKALFEAFVNVMQSLGYITMAVWVSEQNPATGFYCKMGGELIDRKMYRKANIDIPEVAYRYYIDR